MSRFLTLLVGSLCLLLCGPSPPRTPVAQLSSEQQTKETDKKKDSPRSEPVQYPPHKKPELATEPPEGITPIVSPAKVREPEARYERPGLETAAQIHTGEVPVALATPEALTDRSRRLLSADLDESKSTNDILVFGPNSIPAMGRHHIAEPVDQGVRFRRRDGSGEYVAGLADLFVGGGSPELKGDWRVIYDSFADRFVVVALERLPEGTDTGIRVSRIRATVSDDGQPEGEWFSVTIDPGVGPSGGRDMIGFYRLAIDPQFIYILLELSGENHSLESTGVSVWVIEKGLGSAGFYFGGRARVMMH